MYTGLFRDKVPQHTTCGITTDNVIFLFSMIMFEKCIEAQEIYKPCELGSGRVSLAIICIAVVLPRGNCKATRRRKEWMN